MAATSNALPCLRTSNHCSKLATLSFPTLDESWYRYHHLALPASAFVIRKYMVIFDPSPEYRLMVTIRHNGYGTLYISNYSRDICNIPRAQSPSSSWTVALADILRRRLRKNKLAHYW